MESFNVRHNAAEALAAAIATCRHQLSVASVDERTRDTTDSWLSQLTSFEKGTEMAYSQIPNCRTWPPLDLVRHVVREAYPPVSAAAAYQIAFAIDAAGSQSFADAVWREFIRRPEEFEGKTILFPTPFRDQMERHLSRRAYQTGRNATALGDWEEFRRQLTESGPVEPRLTTGLACLDAATGGLPQLTVLAGAAGVGKTAFALSVARRAIQHDPGLAVLLYSLDMSKGEIYRRLLCAEAGLSLRDLIAKGTDCTAVRAEAEGRLEKEVLQRLSVREWNCAVQSDAGILKNDPLSVKQMLSHRKLLQEASGARRFLVIIDLLQHLNAAPPTSTPTASGESTGEPSESTELEADLHRLALLRTYMERTVSAGAPCGDSILVVSETRKSGSRREALQMDDVRGHGRILFVADCVLLLEVDEEGRGHTADVEPVTLTVAKCRDGRKGPLSLLFDHQIYRFREAPRVGQSRKTAQTPGCGRDPLAGLS